MEERVNAILEFIEKQPDYREAPKQDPTPEAKPNPPETPQAPEAPQIPTPAAPQIPIYEDTKLYNRVNTRLRNVKNFPYVLKLPTENLLFNTQEELNAYRMGIMDKRKEFTRQQRNNKISNSKMDFDKLPQVEDEAAYIVEDNVMYKRRDPDAVIKNDKKYKIPRTSPQDAKKIYTDISRNKENLKRLAKSKDEEEFKTATRESISNENVKRIYEQHEQNDINPDRTWTRESFYKYISKMMEEETGQKPQKKQTQQNLPLFRTPAIYGLNPDLIRK